MPTRKDLIALIGGRLSIFLWFEKFITYWYCIERVPGSWFRKGEKWDYEFRIVGKTLCYFYFRKDTLGFMLIFGKEEQASFEKMKMSWSFSKTTVEAYDSAYIDHDSRWIKFSLKNRSLCKDILRLLVIKSWPKQWGG